MSVHFFKVGLAIPFLASTPLLIHPKIDHRKRHKPRFATSHKVKLIVTRRKVNNVEYI